MSLEKIIQPRKCRHRYKLTCKLKDLNIGIFWCLKCNDVVARKLDGG